MLIALIGVWLVALVLALNGSHRLLVCALLLSSLTVYRWDVAGIGQLSPYRLFLLLALLRLVLEAARGRRLAADPLFCVLVGMCLWDGVGLLYSQRSSEGLRVVLQEVEYPITYFVVANVLVTPRRLAAAFRAFMVSVLAAVGLTFWQWVDVTVRGNYSFQWPLWQFTRLAERAWLLGVVGTRDASSVYDRVSSVLGDSINFSNLTAVAACICIVGLARSGDLALRRKWKALFTLILVAGFLL
ncbi:MAG: hypothetical protein ACYC5O_04445, partial [Anaerolineae bacterium]